MNQENLPLPDLPESPLVSIVVPSYNQGRFIDQTLTSILSQSYRPLEILVMDGGSTDETIDVLRSYSGTPELRWWSEPDDGVVDAVNGGFSKARGEIGAVQSSDDCYLSGAIETVVAHMRAHPDLGLVYGDIVTIDAEGTELSRTRNPPFSLRGLLSKETWIPQPAAFFRTCLFRELGGWNERFFNADTEMWYRMAFRTRVEKIPSLLAQRRRHDAQRDLNHDEILESYRRMIETSPDIQASPRGYRQAAKCGKHLHALRYPPQRHYRPPRWYYCWRAALAYPKVVRRSHVRRGLIPGYGKARALLSRLKSWGLSLLPANR